MSSDLSICILTRNQPELLRLCVASCISEIERAGITGEVIIIDNASADGSPQRVAHLFPTVRIIRNEENLGFAAANNKAIRVSRGGFVLLLNDDAVLQQGSLELMLQKLESNPKIGALGPKLLNPDGSAQSRYTNRRFPQLRDVLFLVLHLEEIFEKKAFTRDLFTPFRDSELSGETDHIAGACLMARREALDAVGLFDEGFYYWFEDTDLCYRLKKAGWRIAYLAEARVTHYGSASLNKLPQLDRSAMFLRSQMYFFKRHSSPPRYFLLRLTLASVLCLRLPLFILFRICRSGWNRREWSDSMRAFLSAVRLLVFE